MIDSLLDTLGSNWSTVFLSISCCLAVLIWWNSLKPKNLPPGPSGLPFIGSLIDLIKHGKSNSILEFNRKLHEEYGSIVTFTAGVQRFVYINDGKLVTQLYNSDEFSIRPVTTFSILRELSHGEPKGVLFNNGEGNKEMRRFALMSFRDFGVGKKSIDEMVQSEASILCDYLSKQAEQQDGVVSDLKIKMQYATANVIHHIIFGFRYDYEDPKWLSLVQAISDFFSINLLVLPQNYLPFLDAIPPLKHYLSDNQDLRFMKTNDCLEEYIDSQIQEHRTTYCEGEIRDFVDLYIKYECESKEHYTKRNIFQTILDLFRAGSDTTANSVSWAIMHLVKNPDIQQELREEIEQVIGSRPYAREDKGKLIKVRAFVNEVHRYVSIAPFAPPHTVDKPAKIGDYIIPANSLIITSLYDIHHDGEYWDQPFEFNINRWIDENGELLRHEGHFMPFSIGKRVCPGRQIANLEFFVLLIEFLQRLKFGVAEGYPEIDEAQGPGFLRNPANFYFKLFRRL